jgi:predicted transcriptional regulator
MTNVAFSMRIDADTNKRLKYEADNMNRSETYFASMAIGKELNAREFKRAAIDAALAQAEQGDFISSEAMGAWVDSWGSDRELTAPKNDIKAKK